MIPNQKCVESLLSEYEKEFKIEFRERINVRWKELDNKLFHENKNRNLISKGFAVRTIWTPEFDLITFKRRRYVDKVTGKTRYLLDEEIGLRPRQYVLPRYRELALFYYRVFQSYQEIASHVYQGRVTAMSVHRFIKEQGNDFLMQNYTCVEDGILWINADGLWQKLHKSKQMVEIKNFAFYTGKELNARNKWSLTGRVVKHFIDTGLEIIADELNKIVDGFADVREIRLIGDGAKWIRKIAKLIGAEFYIDKFHFRKALRNLVGNHFYHKALTITSQDENKHVVRQSLLQLIVNPTTGEITSKQLKLLGYVMNSYEAYTRSVSDKTSNHIEALQAHYEAKYIKNRRKGFSIVVLNIILTNLLNWTNGGWQFHALPKDPFDFDVGLGRTGKNIPILNYGLSSTGTYKMIQGLIRS